MLIFMGINIGKRSWCRLIVMILLVLHIITTIGFSVVDGREMKMRTKAAVEEELEEKYDKYAPIFIRSLSSSSSSPPAAMFGGNGNGKAASVDGAVTVHAVSRRLVPCGPNPLHN